jgi:eukaryotic-like serine/threonine-protein kinase
VLFAFVIAALATALAIVVGAEGAESADEPTLVATTSETSLPTETVPTETLTAPEPTTPTPTEPPPPEEEPEPPPPPPGPIEWPAGRDGWTIVLASIPEAAGRRAALAKAREALRAGVPDAGVLDSGEFPSLTPGYFVVFSGVHADQAAANRALPQAEDAYPAAYVRQVSRQ